MKYNKKNTKIPKKAFKKIYLNAFFERDDIIKIRKTVIHITEISAYFKIFIKPPVYCMKILKL